MKKNHIRPEQVQDFYPTPGTISTCMFYTELDPYTMEKVYVAKTEHEKALQRALLQYYNPKNQAFVEEALKKAKRFDLIGFDSKCLVRPTAQSLKIQQKRQQVKNNYKRNTQTKNNSKKGKRK